MVNGWEDNGINLIIIIIWTNTHPHNIKHYPSSPHHHSPPQEATLLYYSTYTHRQPTTHPTAHHTIHHPHTHHTLPHTQIHTHSHHPPHTTNSPSHTTTTVRLQTQRHKFSGETHFLPSITKISPGRCKHWQAASVVVKARQEGDSRTPS